MISVAVIGAGHWHALYDGQYLLHLADMAHVDIVGISDPDVDLATERAARVGDVAVYADYQEMLDTTRPDFVVALGAHNAMAETAHYLIDAGYPFFMEKPMGVDAAEVAEIFDHATLRAAFAAVPLVQRYSPQARLAQTLFGYDGDRGGGAPTHYYFRFVKATPTRYIEQGSPWMLDPVATGGGCLRNFGVHGMDLFTRLVGEPVEVLAATTSNATYGLGIEDHATVLLRSSSGVTGVIEVGYTLPAPLRDAELRVTGLGAYLKFSADNLTVMTTSGVQRYEIDPDLVSPYRVMLSDALRCWQEGLPPTVGIADCLSAVTLVDAAYAMAGPMDHRSETTR
jgi:predicted dehydrogenase